MEKTDHRRLPEQERLVIRRTAIKLIKQGKRKKEVAILFGVKSGTISDWVKKHNKQGDKGLQSKKRGVKSEDKKLLNREQERQIQRIIIDKMPDQLKFPYALWTRKAVKELVEREFGIVVAINTMGDYLRKWGFTPQKPKKRAYEQCPKAVQKWIDEQYPAIEERAKQEGAEIHWGDETGIKNNCNHGRSYSPKGKTPVKKSMSKRFSINMISSVTNRGKVQFMIYSGSMNSDRFIEFMEQLTKNSLSKIFLIVDNLKTHHSRIVKEWLAEDENKLKIEVFYLPSYSPERNPDEYLNCDLKQGMSAIPSPRSQNILEKSVENHMLMLQQKSDRVVKYFKHESIKYAA